jgi:hypothetical protein
MPNATTMRFMQGQILAMRVPVFEVGAYKSVESDSGHRHPEMLMRTWDSQSLLRSIGWLRLQNLQGRNIYVRPKGEHQLSLLDDLSSKTIEQMKSEGFNPAVVVETSPGNFQAWVNHGQVLPKEHSTKAARALAERFQGDPSSADWRHFGRLAGFTNRKQKYRGKDGLFPFVKLIEASGQVYPHAKAFLTELRQSFEAARPVAPQQTFRTVAADQHHLQTITDFKQKLAYKEDGNRIDLAYAIYALSHRVAESEVRAAVASRDLSHKGNPKRQADYIERTIQKAWNVIRVQARER